MSLVSHKKVEQVVSSRLKTAIEIADSEIVFNERMAVAKSLFISNLPDSSSMRLGYGYAARGVILSVDLRSSSARAIRIGARDTFVTMHTYLPTMAFLVGQAGGKVIGLRGDGLFAIFGRTRIPSAVKRSSAEFAVAQAVSCGRAMLEVVRDYIGPALAQQDIDGDLRIGVGIAIGSVVVTRIGWRDANEVTIYGPAVNIACKFRGNNEILVTKNVWNLLPDAEIDEATIFGCGVAGGIQLIVTGNAPSVIGE